jgi:hypothetical protein
MKTKQIITRTVIFISILAIVMVAYYAHVNQFQYQP